MADAIVRYPAQGLYIRGLVEIFGMLFYGFWHFH